MALDFKRGAQPTGQQDRTSYGIMHNWLMITPRRRSRRAPAPAAEAAPQSTRASAVECLVTDRTDRQQALRHLVAPKITDTANQFALLPPISDPRKSNILAYQAENYKKLPIYPVGRGHDQNPPVHLQYGVTSRGYDDYHRAFLHYADHTSNEEEHIFPKYGPPRLRNGNGGGSWRHIKNSLQSEGGRHLFIDGQVSLSDRIVCDDVEKGHLIVRNLNTKDALSKHKLDDMFMPKRLATPKQSPLDQMNNRRSAQKGRESNNWWSMR